MNLYRGIWWFGSLALVSAIFYLSVLTPYIPTIEMNHIDKVYHLIAYGSLMGWLAQGLNGKQRLFALGLVILFGIAIEFIQPYTGRSFDPLDMLANSIGALSALLAVHLGANWLTPYFHTEPRA